MLLDSLAVQQRCGRKCRIWNMALASRRDHCLQCPGFVGSCWVVGDPFGVSMVSVLSHDRDWDDLGAPQRLRKHLNNSFNSCSKIIIPIRIPCYNAMFFWWSRVQKIFVEWCWMVSSWYAAVSFAGEIWTPLQNSFSNVFTAGWGPSSLAKLVQTTIITVVYDTQITIFRWGYNPAYNWRAPSCVVVCFTPKKRVMAGDCRGLPLYLNRRVCHGEWPCFIPGHVPWWTLKFQGSRRLKSKKHHHPFVKSTKHGFLGEISSVHQHLWCVNPYEIHHFLPLGLPSVEIWGLLDLCYLDGRGGMGNGWWNGWFTHVSHIYIHTCI